MKHLVIVALVSISTSTAVAQTVGGERNAIPTSIVNYTTSQPTVFFNDAGLRSNKNTGLRSDFMHRTPKFFEDFPTLAPAAGGPIPRNLLNDRNIRSDKKTALRSDVMAPIPLPIEDFTTLAPAAGEPLPSTLVNDTNLRSDTRMGLRSDRATSSPRY